LLLEIRKIEVLKRVDPEGNAGRQEGGVYGEWGSDPETFTAHRNGLGGGNWIQRDEKLEIQRGEKLQSLKT